MTDDACSHPFDSVNAFNITMQSGGEVSFIRWCTLCGALQCRDDVDNLAHLSRAPWLAWRLPERGMKGKEDGNKAK
jgi:hypothetical protein